MSDCDAEPMLDEPERRERALSALRASPLVKDVQPLRGDRGYYATLWCRSAVLHLPFHFVRPALGVRPALAWPLPNCIRCESVPREACRVGGEWSAELGVCARARIYTCV